MGLFGNDEEQDIRLNELENHIKNLTYQTQQNQADIASIQLQVIAIEKQISTKISKDEIDPAFSSISQEIKIAREELQKASTSASETWGPLQTGATESLNILRDKINKLNVQNVVK